MYLSPVFFTHSRSCSSSSADIPAGTALMTCLPAFMASVAIQMCSGAGVNTATPSNCGCFRNSLKLLYVWPGPYTSVKRLRRSSRRSQSATTLQLGSRCHWKEEPKPPPTIPILTCFSDAPGPMGPAELADNGEASRRLAAVRATADPPTPSRNFLRVSGPFLFLDIVDTSFRNSHSWQTSHHKDTKTRRFTQARTWWIFVSLW